MTRGLACTFVLCALSMSAYAQGSACEIPPGRRDTTYSAFLQYDLALVPDKFRLIAGSKFEHNSYMGFEYQPQIRAVWTPGKQHTLWAAFSRPVRTPTRLEANIFFRAAQMNPDPPPPTLYVIAGDPNVKSEVLHAYEVGYRYQSSLTGEKFAGL
jgi:iron complex outermembrane receptor protein